MSHLLPTLAPLHRLQFLNPQPTSHLLLSQVNQQLPPRKVKFILLRFGSYIS